MAVCVRVLAWGRAGKKHTTIKGEQNEQHRCQGSEKERGAGKEEEGGYEVIAWVHGTMSV